MDAKGKKRIVIWVSVATLLGVGGYFAYIKVIKPKLDEMKAKKAAELAAANAAANTNTPAPSGNSAPSSNESESANTNAYKNAWNKARENKVLAFNFSGKVYATATGKVFPNPFQNSKQIEEFQKLVKYTLKDNSIGDIDGKWGAKTASAFIKYGYNYYTNRI